MALEAASGRSAVDKTILLHWPRALTQSASVRKYRRAKRHYVSALTGFAKLFASRPKTEEMPSRVLRTVVTSLTPYKLSNYQRNHFDLRS
jgi:hypothetical protein